MKAYRYMRLRELVARRGPYSPDELEELRELSDQFAAEWPEIEPPELVRAARWRLESEDASRLAVKPREWRCPGCDGELYKGTASTAVAHGGRPLALPPMDVVYCPRCRWRRQATADDPDAFDLLRRRT